MRVTTQHVQPLTLRRGYTVAVPGPKEIPFQQKYDIFICGGVYHFHRLHNLLPRLAGFGTIHLASISLNEEERASLADLCDFIHQPRHDPDGYRNFNLFCIRDINRLAVAPYFIKLDADLLLAEDWIDYVEETILQQPEVVLFGPTPGIYPVDVDLSGPLVEGLLGRKFIVPQRVKVHGRFYVGQSSFFRKHNRAMQTIHELLYCFRNGRRIRPRLETLDATDWDSLEPLGFSVGGHGVGNLQRIPDEDVLRNLIAYAYGGDDVVRVIPAGDRIPSRA
jgi:hypothetical protein